VGTKEIRSVELKIRARPSLKLAIERAAKQEGRSVSNWIERAAEEALKRK
jgi:predicted HicB family RNase H-like nuclease